MARIFKIGSSWGGTLVGMTATQTDTRTLRGPFEVTGWDETPPYDQPADGPALGRVTVRKRFTGVFAGQSVAELLTAVGPGGQGYVASERFTGTIDGRAGTVVFQHGGLTDGSSGESWGHVVPGSGTGELAGLSGSLTMGDETGHRATLVVPAAWGR